MTAVEFGYSLTTFSTKLKSFAMKLTKDHEDANDLLQETMLKAYSNRDKFKEGTNLNAWLYTIMRNTFLSNYQKASRRKLYFDGTNNNHFLNSSSHTIENDAIGTFKMEKIREGLRSVPSANRIPFLLYYKGYKYNEIAERLKIPVGTVKNRIHIARKELKKQLKVYRS